MSLFEQVIDLEDLFLKPRNTKLYFNNLRSFTLPQAAAILFDLAEKISGSEWSKTCLFRAKSHYGALSSFFRFRRKNETYSGIGKGFFEIESDIGSVAEAIERFFLTIEYPKMAKPIRTDRSSKESIKSFVESLGSNLKESEILDSSIGFQTIFSDLSTIKSVFVPIAIFSAFGSNGLSVGLKPEEAIVHSLIETFERRFHFLKEPYVFRTKEFFSNSIIENVCRKFFLSKEEIGMFSKICPYCFAEKISDFFLISFYLRLKTKFLKVVGFSLSLEEAFRRAYSEATQFEHAFVQISEKIAETISEPQEKIFDSMLWLIEQSVVPYKILDEDSLISKISKAKRLNLFEKRTKEFIDFSSFLDKFKTLADQSGVEKKFFIIMFTLDKKLFISHIINPEVPIWIRPPLFESFILVSNAIRETSWIIKSKVEEVYEKFKASSSLEEAFFQNPVVAETLFYAVKKNMLNLSEKYYIDLKRLFSQKDFLLKLDMKHFFLHKKSFLSNI